MFDFAFAQILPQTAPNPTNQGGTDNYTPPPFPFFLQCFKNSTTTKPTNPYTFLTQLLMNYSTIHKEKENYTIHKEKENSTMNAELITALSALAVGIIALITQTIYRYLAKKKKITLQELITLYGDNVYAKCPNCNTEIKLSQLQLYTKDNERS